ALAAARGPAMHHRVSHVGMKLKAGGVPVLKRLHRKIVALGQQFGANRQLKSFAMPVIDPLRPVRAKRVASFGRTDRIVAYLRAALRVRCDPGAELFGEHLGTQANAKEWTLLAQGNFDPVDLAANIIVAVIGAHRAAEDDAPAC